MSKLPAAFGFPVHSEIPLDSLPLQETFPGSRFFGNDENKTLTIRLRSFTVPDIQGIRMGNIHFFPLNRAIYIQVPSVGNFCIENPWSILVDPEKNPKAGIVELFLTGLVLPFVLHLHPLVSFHGSSVLAGGGAWVFLGFSGAGKSTTSAGFAARGYSLLCDDVVPVHTKNRQIPYVLPGIARSKLLPDALKNLEFSRNSNEVENQKNQIVFDGNDKYQVVFSASAEGADCTRIFLLEPYSGDSVKLEKVTGSNKFLFVKPHVHLLQGVDNPAEHLQRFSEVLNKTEIWKIYRPTSRFALSEVITILEEDFL